MPYTPDPTDGSQPIDTVKASQMGAEFRALKTYIQSTVLAAAANKAPLGGAGASGTWGISITGNAATATSATNATNAANAAALLPVAVGAASVKTGRNSWGVGVYGYKALSDPNSPTPYTAGIGFGNGGGGSVEILGSWFNAPDLWFRSIRDITDSWTSWINICHAGNIGAFAPSLTGTGAIGVWNIGVNWSGIVGRPTNLSQFINDIGAGGGGGSGTLTSFQGRSTAAAVLIPSDVTGALGYTPYSAANPSAFISLAQVAAAGYQTSSGTVASATNATAVNGTGSNGYGNRTVATTVPSGGADGDIWYQV